MMEVIVIYDVMVALQCLVFEWGYRWYAKKHSAKVLPYRLR